MTNEEFDVKMNEFEKILQQTAGDVARGAVPSGNPASELGRLKAQRKRSSFPSPTSRQNATKGSKKS